MTEKSIPETLEEAQRLPEIAPDKPHILDLTLPVLIFLDKGNRLMQVVKDIAGTTFYKMEAQ